MVLLLLRVKGDGHGLLTSAVALPFGVVPLQVWWFSHPSVSLLFLSGWMITGVTTSCRGLTLRGSSFFANMVDMSSHESSPSSLGLKVGRGLLTSAMAALRGIAFARTVDG